MVQIILLIVGVVYAFRRPKISKLKPEQFPNVPHEVFDQWKRLELRSIDIFLWATWGVAIIGTVIAFVIVQSNPTLAGPIQIAYIVVFLVGLIFSAIDGSKAAKIRKSHAIPWPPK